MADVYPSWRYHATKEPVLVLDEAADKALGPGWEHSPAVFFEAKYEPKAEKPAKKVK